MSSESETAYRLYAEHVNDCDACGEIEPCRRGAELVRCWQKAEDRKARIPAMDGYRARCRVCMTRLKTWLDAQLHNCHPVILGRRDAGRVTGWER